MHVMSVTHIRTSAYTTSTGISLNLLIGMLPFQLSLDPAEIINGHIITPRCIVPIAPPYNA